MPEIFPRRVADRSVRQALSNMRGELLPGEIREDSLANWVMRFDELQRRQDEPHPFQDRGGESAAWAVNLVVLSSLQKRIPFYFGALFHIGRQWKVSESASRALERASQGENLDLSTRLTLDNLRTRGVEDKRLFGLFERQGSDMTQALSVLFESAGNEHSNRLREARRWWSAWQEEVRLLRSQIDRLEEASRGGPDYRLWREAARFVLDGYRPSALRGIMEVSGVKFSGEPDRASGPWTGSYAEVLAPLMLLGLSSGGKEPFFEHIMFEWRHVFHDFEQEARYGELRRAALSRLTRKYAQGEDPFEPYLPLKKPATEQLRYLWIEHNLPGYQDSPWLDAWQRCLDDDPERTVDFSVRGKVDSNLASGFARTADSAIKRHIRDDYTTGETWSQFIQRLFESRWVYQLAKQISHTNRKSGGVKWSFAFFRDLVSSVVAILNDVGYDLALPSEDRLERLWERLHKEEPKGTLDW
jgi:hypothetical protein